MTLFDINTDKYDDINVFCPIRSTPEKLFPCRSDCAFYMLDFLEGDPDELVEPWCAVSLLSIVFRRHEEKLGDIKKILKGLIKNE